jgi:hypothetical protein
MNRFTTYKSIAVVLCLSFFAPALARAQDADEKELGAYQLTMPNVRKAKAALDEMKRMKFEAPVKGDDETFDAMTRKIEQNPKVMGALRNAGIGAKDFLMTVTAVVAISMTMAMTEGSGVNLPAHLRAHQKFMIANEKELKPLLPAFVGDDQ